MTIKINRAPMPESIKALDFQSECGRSGCSVIATHYYTSHGCTDGALCFAHAIELVNAINSVFLTGEPGHCGHCGEWFRTAADFTKVIRL